VNKRDEGAASVEGVDGDYITKGSEVRNWLAIIYRVASSMRERSSNPLDSERKEGGLVGKKKSFVRGGEDVIVKLSLLSWGI